MTWSSAFYKRTYCSLRFLFLAEGCLNTASRFYLWWDAVLITTVVKSVVWATLLISKVFLAAHRTHASFVFFFPTSFWEKSEDCFVRKSQEVFYTKHANVCVTNNHATLHDTEVLMFDMNINVSHALHLHDLFFFALHKNGRLFDNRAENESYSKWQYYLFFFKQTASSCTCKLE